MIDLTLFVISQLIFDILILACMYYCMRSNKCTNDRFFLQQLQIDLLKRMIDNLDSAPEINPHAVNEEIEKLMKDHFQAPKSKFRYLEAGIMLTVSAACMGKLLFNLLFK